MASPTSIATHQSRSAINSSCAVGLRVPSGSHSILTWGAVAFIARSGPGQTDFVASTAAADALSGFLGSSVAGR
jgi:hypothetical protein